MEPARVRAQAMEAARALAEAVERRGAEWWASWDSLQWSPVGMFCGGPYRGRDRLALAALSLSRGHRDRRWVPADELEAHGLRPRRGARGALVGVGDGAAMAYNAESVVRRNARGVRHGTAVPADVLPPGMGGEDVTRAVAALVSCGICPVLRDRCERARYLPETGVVAVPNATRWGHGASELRELCAALALAAVRRRQRDGAPGDEGEAALVATLASVMALSDAGMAPREARGAHGSAASEEGSLPATVRLVNDADALMACADLAEEASALLSPMLTRSRACTDGGRPSQAAPPEVRDEGDGAGRGQGPGADACVRPPTRKPNLVPYGRYRLRDVVAESERASEALAARDCGRRWGT